MGKTGPPAEKRPEPWDYEALEKAYAVWPQGEREKTGGE